VETAPAEGVSRELALQLAAAVEFDSTHPIARALLESAREENPPRDIVRIIRLSRATYRKMVQNLWWAAGYNIVAIPLAAGVLAWAGILLVPAVGAVLMSASTVIVAINAQLLRRLEL